MTKNLFTTMLWMFIALDLTCCTHTGEDEYRDGGEAPDSCCDAGDMDSGMDGGPDADVIPPGCDGVIEFPDPVLDHVVRTDLGKLPDEDIYYEDVQRLRVLNFGIGCDSFEVPKIENLEGLQCLDELQELYLTCNSITDISQVAYLMKLERISFDYNIGISDIRPLAGLVHLTMVDFTVTAGIEDISPLEQLTQIEYLFLGGNGIRDIGVLKNLVNIKSLELDDNSIESISSLEYLSHINFISINRNLIKDITPLVNNPGLGNGDGVNIIKNPLDCDEQAGNIEALRARGVRIQSDCDLPPDDAGI